MSNVKVAIVQARPVYYDLPATVEKAVSLIREAAKEGATLIAFGETFFPGYPIWLDVCSEMGIWDNEPTKEVFLRLYQNCMTVPGTETNTFCQLARELKVALVLGINERVEKKAGHGTLYNTLITIDATGDIVNHHRKLMPTYTERIMWGQGDGAGLKAVDTTAGRIGGLICWEHWMPLARQALHETQEQIHIAAWPTVNDHRHQIASRHYAFEGRCFVLAAGSILPAGDVPAELPLHERFKDHDLVQRGGSTIIAPDGRYIVEPCWDREHILYAELDLTEVIKESMTLDVTGHYSRPDVFAFKVNDSRR